MRSYLPALALAVLLVAGPSAAGPAGKTPTNLQAAFDSQAQEVLLTWDPVSAGNAQFVYPVWRDGVYVGTSSSPGLADAVDAESQGMGLIYFVSSAPPGNPDNAGMPAVVGVPIGLGCEMVSTSTSWSPPFLHATLHMECLGMAYQKEATWTAPA